MEALTAAERDFEQAAVYWKQEAEKYRLAGLADKERLDWLESSSAQIFGEAGGRTVFAVRKSQYSIQPTRPTTREAIDEAMRQCQPEPTNALPPAE